MNLPTALIEQLPFVAVFVLFTAYLVKVGLRAEEKGRAEYVAAMAEARTQYIEALAADRKEFIATLHAMSAEIHNLSESVNQIRRVA